ncbi:MAG: hypothetical protein K0S48_44 [Ramlibacter sp.]|jgi:DNA-binding transcriptional ArsR family regulator|nr:hypothetical protein [Ramlibacter sp.]
MTRTYAAKRLLEHGPLTFTEMREITGWPARVVAGALRSLMETGVAVAERCGRHKNLYRLAA